MSLPVKGRKRHYFDDDEDMIEATNLFPTNRPSMMAINKQHTATLKRTKTGISKKTPLDLKLATMDKTKLLDVLDFLLETHPDLKHNMMTYIPAPTIPSTLAVLNDLEKKMWASFPYNKRGPQRDHYTFSRVRESLMDLIDAITHFTHHFVSSPFVFPTTCFTYLDLVTYFAHRLPTWDDDHHQNQPRRDLYDLLGNMWKQAIQRTFDTITHESATFPTNTITLWAQHLANHTTLAGSHSTTFDNAIQHFNHCFLLPPPPPPPMTAVTTPAVIGSPIVGLADLR